MNVPRAKAVPIDKTIVLALTMAATVLAGLATTTVPLATMGLAGLALLIATMTLEERLPGIFLAGTGVLLAGYATLGKGFAYIGVPPLFVGEAVLVIGMLALIFVLPQVRLTGMHLLLLGFMVLGLLRTLPYVFSYWINTFRDAALWYYGFYALVISVLLERRHIELAVRWITRLLPALVAWLGLTAVIGPALESRLPHLPGSPVAIYYMKPGDRGVMLVGIATFLLLGLAEPFQKRSRSTVTVWGLWFLGATFVAVLSRGGLLAMASAGMLVFLLRPSRRWLKPALCVITMGTLLILIDPSVPSSYGGRTVSVSQLFSNVTSILSSDESAVNGSSGLSDTKTWRLEWWGRIYDYTVKGPYFWSGKGFGINLATDDGFQVQANQALRSPHSSHMTVLARMGVPGMVAWIALQLTFAAQLGRAYAWARARGEIFWMNVDIWLLAMWLAIIVNSSFDVYLEGPQGGIWFWSVLGAGLAVLRLQHLAPVPDAGHSPRLGGNTYAVPLR